MKSKENQPEILYDYLGRVEYSKAVQLMEEHIIQAHQTKKAYWWGLEHDLVYTAGISTEKEHVLDSSLFITQSRRGGSVTVHNPGQLIFYSVFPLAMVCGGLQAYIRFLEASIIETFWQYGVFAFLSPPNSGVWTRRGKIAFVGLGMKKGMIYHGVAINLINHLDDYQKIQSCGLRLPVSRLEDETNIQGKKNSLDTKHILEEFSFQLKENLKTRFIQKKRGNEFRDYAMTKKQCFPSSMLAFQLGQLFFNERRYWEAHEAWEVFWHEYTKGDFKLFLGGLIQLASALYKLTLDPNLRGATSLFKKSFEKLKDNRYVDMYLTNLEEYGSVIVYIEKSMCRIKKFNLAESEDKGSQEEINIRFIQKKKELFRPYILISRYDRLSGFELHSVV